MILYLTSVARGFKQITDDGVYYNVNEGLTSIPDDIPDTSEQINLCSNAIRDPPPGTFINLPHADLLDLSDNLFCDIARFMLVGLIALKHLNLGRNNITSIDDYAFCQVPELRRLDVPNNQIAYLPSVVFSCLKHLNYLDVDGNPLTTLEPIDRGLTLTLALRIPVFQCDSRMCWLWEEVRQRRIRIMTDKKGSHTPHCWDLIGSICLVQGNRTCY